MRNRWRKFLSYYKPYRLRFAVVLFFSLVAAGASLLFPLYARQAAEAAGAGFSAPGLGRAVVIMLCLAAVEVFADTYYDYFGHCVGADMENDLRQELFGHLEQLSYGYYDTHRVGEIMSSLTNDLQNLSELYHHGPEDYLVNAVRFVGASCILFVIDWRLTLCLYAFLPPMAILTLCLNRRVRRAADESQARIADINARAEDALSGIRVSQAFANEEREKGLFAAAGARFTASRKRIYGNESVEYQSLTALTRLMYVAVIGLGALGIARGDCNPADLIAFLLYITSLTEPVRHLAWMTTQYQQGLAGFSRVADILETEPEIADLPGARPLGAVEGEVAFEGVTFRYRDGLDVVLRHVDMRVKAGECVAVAGVSGAGKSTLCALIPRFYEPECGRVTVDGRDVRSCTLASLRAAVSVVPQDPFLFSGPLRENIRYGRPGATDEQVEEAARMADADAFIARLPQGYDTDVGPRGVRLSGGQRQRIAIARAFLRDAPILLMDEATSALDSESEKAIHRALRRLREGRTTILVAHRLSTIREADRVVVLSEGGVAEEGLCDELLQNGGAFAGLYPDAAAPSAVARAIT